MRTLSTRSAMAGASLLTATLLVACGSGTTPASSPTATPPPAPSPSSKPVETHEASARVVVGFADAVKVLDAESLTPIASFDVATAPYLEVASDGRHVFTLENQQKKVRILDSGTWTAAHGDHGHSYTTSPSRLDTVIEGTAYHAISDSKRSVIWNDDTGNIEVIEAPDFADGNVKPAIIERNDKHHGVAVPLSTGYLASFSAGDEAAGIVKLDAKGAELARYEGCAGLHGEAHIGTDAYAFGCSDGIMVVDGTGSRKIAAPVAGASTTSLVGDGSSPIIAGNLRAKDNPGLATVVALYDTAAGTTRTIDLGVEWSNMVVSESNLVVIGLDGNLHLVELTSGATRTIKATEPWTKPKEFLDARPMLAASHDHVWLTDPMTGKILVIDITTGETVKSASVEGKPDRIVVVNFAGDEHDHD